MRKFKLGDKKFDLNNVEMIAHNVHLFYEPDGFAYLQFVSVFNSKNCYDYKCMLTKDDSLVKAEINEVYRRLKSENVTSFVFLENNMILNLDNFEKVELSTTAGIHTVRIVCKHNEYTHQTNDTNFAKNLYESINKAKQEYDKKKEENKE